MQKNIKQLLHKDYDRKNKTANIFSTAHKARCKPENYNLAICYTLNNWKKNWIENNNVPAHPPH